MTEELRDYSRLPWDELQSILDHINPDVAPINYARLLEEIERRRPQIEREVADAQEQADNEFASALEFRVEMRPYLGWFQILTALVFAWYALTHLLAGSINSGLLGVAITALLAVAGLLLVRGSTWGYLLTAALAVASLIAFKLGNAVYWYHGMFAVNVSVFGGPEGDGLGFYLHYAPALVFDLVDRPGWFVSVNVIAAVVLGILFPTRTDIAAIREAAARKPKVSFD